MVHSLTALVAAQVAAGPPKRASCAASDDAASDQSTCAEGISRQSSSDGLSSAASLAGPEDESSMGREVMLTVAQLAGNLAKTLSAVAEDRARDAARWGSLPIGLRQSGGAYGVFQPQLAAKNAGLLMGVVREASDPLNEGFGRAVARARRGLTRGGECRAVMEKACHEARAAALASLRAAQRRRAEALEAARMRQGRGRAALGCSRPSDVGPETLALRLELMFGSGAEGTAAAAELKQASDSALAHALAWHAQVKTFVQFLEALDQQ